MSERVFWDPAAYGDQAAWHATVAEFRRSQPVVRVESPHHPPFWAVTRHADIHWIERHPDRFPNTDRSVLATDAQYEAQARQGAALRTLIHMDGNEHRQHRAVTAGWFKPSSVRSLEARVADLARAAVDPAETARFGTIVRRLVAEADVGVLLVEHDMSLVMEVCDFLYTLDFGQLIFAGTPAETRASATVRAAYLGDDDAALVER